MHTQIAKNCIRFSVVKYDGQTWMIETKHSIKGTVLLVGPNEKGRQIFNDKEVEVLYTPAQLAVYFINTLPPEEVVALAPDFIGDDFSDDMPTLINNKCAYTVEPGTIAGTFTLTIYGEFQTGESEVSYLYFSQDAITHDIELAAKAYKIEFRNLGEFHVTETQHKVLVIASRENGGHTCTEEESAYIKRYVKETAIAPGSFDVQLIEMIQLALPCEYGEAIDEMEEI